MSSSINPENPYVFNENYYENATHVIYKETTFYLIFRISYILCALFSLLLIGLVVFLVIFKTPKPFKPYSKMLLIYSIVDCYFTIGEFLMQLRVNVNEIGMIITLTGPLSHLSYQNQCYMLGLLGSSAILCNNCIPVQYYIRYRIIKYKKSPSTFQTVLYFLVAIFLACPSFYSTPRTYCSYENKDRIEFARYWNHEVPIPKLFVGMQSHPPYIINFTYLVTVQFFSYMLSFIFARKSLAELHGKYLSPKTKALQQQLSRTLLTQSLCPFVTIILPPIISILLPLMGIHIKNIGDICIMIFSWSPVLNSVVTIILIDPYRKYCIKSFCFWKKSSIGISNAAVVPIPSTVNRS